MRLGLRSIRTNEAVVSINALCNPIQRFVYAIYLGIFFSTCMPRIYVDQNVTAVDLLPKSILAATSIVIYE